MSEQPPSQPSGWSNFTPGSPDPSPSPPPRAHVPRWVAATLVGSGFVIIALLVVVVVLLTRSDNGPVAKDKGDTPSKTADTFVVAGDITLHSYDGVFKAGGGTCAGQNGYDDMSGGAQVVITDATGKTIGVGSLDEGISESGPQCRFSFAVQDVPEGDGPFGIEVGHRGSIAFKRDSAAALHLTLG